jgi:hypothetical protein
MPILKSGNATRIQNVSTEQTVKAAAGVLIRIVVSNGGASAYTLTIKDNTTTLHVLNVPASSSAFFDFGVAFTSSLKITPSNANVDALVIYS